MQSIFSFIKGFFCGFMAGGVLGLLLAPRPGIETQRLIKQRIDEIITETQRAAEEERRRLEEEFAAARGVKRKMEEETDELELITPHPPLKIKIKRQAEGGKGDS